MSDDRSNEAPSMRSSGFGLSRRSLLAGSAAGAIAGATFGLRPRPADAVVSIDVTQGNIQPIPIALPDFVGGGGNDSEVARAVLTHVFDYALRLLHPIMPFITETLWQRLPGPIAADRCEFLAIAPWPIPHPASPSEDEAMSRFDLVREAVSAVRQIRSDYAIPPGKSIEVLIQSRAHTDLFTQHAPLIGRLSRSTVQPGAQTLEAGAAHSVLVDGSEVIVPLGGLVDLTKECGKLRTELEQLDTQLQALSKRLRNEGFTSRAPKTVVEAEQKKEQEWTKRREQLAGKVKSLCGG
jgi:valyl-tRNA synthetase